MTAEHETNALEAALRLENAAVNIALTWGWYVFPVRVSLDPHTRKRTKHPVVDGWNTPGVGCWNTEAEIRTIFRANRGCKIGVACGPSNIVVLDQDRLIPDLSIDWEMALDPSRTLVLKSQSWTTEEWWRRHFVFTTPVGTGYRSGAIPVGDIKGVGGFVVLGSGRVDGSGDALTPPPSVLMPYIAPAGSLGSAGEVTDDVYDAAIINTMDHDALIGDSSGERYLKVQQIVEDRLNEQYAKWGSRDHAIYRTMCAEVVTCMAGGYPLQVLLDWCLDWVATRPYDSNGSHDPITEEVTRRKLKRALGWATEEAVEEMRRERFFDLDPADLFDWNATLTAVETDPDGLVLNAVDEVIADAVAHVRAESAQEAAARGIGASGMPSLPPERAPSVAQTAHAETTTSHDASGESATEGPSFAQPDPILPPPRPPSMSVAISDAAAAIESSPEGPGTGPPPTVEGDLPPLPPTPPVNEHPPADDKIARLVENKLTDKRAETQAKGIILDEVAQERWDAVAGKLDRRMAGALLAEPRPPVQWTVDGFLQRQQTVLISASPKAGKTRLALNLVRTFVDGDPFLGMPAGNWTGPGSGFAGLAGNTAYLQADMTKDQFLTWTDEQRLTNPQRLWSVDLQGRTGAFDVRSDTVRGRWVELLIEQGCAGGALVIDVLQSIVAGLGLTETNEDLGSLLEGLLALKVEAGLEHLVILHHHGHAAERARGGSVLLGKFDVVADLVLPGRHVDESSGGGGDPVDGGTSALAGSARFFKAYGRGVELEESKLRFEPETGRMTMDRGASRAVSKAKSRTTKMISRVIDVLGVPTRGYDHDTGEACDVWPSLSSRELRAQMTGGTQAKDDIVKEMEADGLIERVFEELDGAVGAPKQILRLTEAGRDLARAEIIAREGDDGMFRDDPHAEPLTPPPSAV